MANKFKDFNLCVKKWLQKDADTGWKSYLIRAEEKIKIDREYILYGFLGLYLAYLVVGSWAQLACNLVAFLYPAFESMTALRTANKDADTQWLTYWVVFGALSLVDFGFERITPYFPFYWVLKIVFLGYLFHSETRGAQTVWDKLLFPAFTKMNLRETPDRAAPYSEKEVGNADAEPALSTEPEAIGQDQLIPQEPVVDRITWTASEPGTDPRGAEEGEYEFRYDEPAKVDQDDLAKVSDADRTQEEEYDR